MATDVTVTINPPQTASVNILGGIVYHASTHAPGGTDSLENYYYPRSNPSGYAPSGDFASISLVTGVSGHLQSQINSISTGTGFLENYVEKTQTGEFLTESLADDLYYPLSSNPNNYLTSLDISSLASTGYVAEASGHLQSQIDGIPQLENFVSLTGDQDISGAKNFFTRPTVNGVGVLLSGEASAAETGFLTGYVSKTETGSFLTTGAGNTLYVQKSETGDYANVFYPLSSNPSNYLVSADLAGYATETYVNNSSGGLQSQINSINSLTGNFTGQFYPLNSNPSGYVRSSQTGAFLTTGAGDIRYVNNTGTQIISGLKTFTQTGIFNATVSGGTGIFGPEHTMGVGFQGPGAIVVGQGMFGGSRNSLIGNNSIIAGGTTNVISGNMGPPGALSARSAILGGNGNIIINASDSVILGGLNNIITGGNASLAFGTANNIRSNRSIVIGSNNNTSSSLSNSVILGRFNSGAAGSYSFGVGNGINITHSSSTVIFNSLLNPFGDFPFNLVGSSGAYTLVIGAESGTFIRGSVQFDNRPSYEGTGFLLSGEAVHTSETGQFYPSNNPSGYITGVDLSTLATQIYVTGISGHLQSQIDNIVPQDTGAFLTTGAGDNRYVSKSETGQFVPYNGATGNVNLNSHHLAVNELRGTSSAGLIIASNNGTTGIIVGAGGSANTTVYGDLKLDYITANRVLISDSAKNVTFSNVTTGELNSLTGISSSVQGQINAITSATGSFVTESFVTGVSGYLQGQIDSIPSPENVVFLTGNQDISGTKNFLARPTVNGTGVLLVGEAGAAETGYLTGYVSKAETGNIAIGTVNFSIDGGGSTLTTGYKAFVPINYNGTIHSFSLLADRTGSVTIDVWKAPFASFPLNSGNSISSSQRPTLATGIRASGLTTGWTTSVVAGDVFGFNINSVSGVQKLNLSISILKS